MAVGDDDKPFKCRFCGKSFTKSRGLGGHMNCHWNELQEEQYHKAVAYLRSKQLQGCSTNPIWERNYGAQAFCPNSNPRPPLCQDVTIAYGNDPRASLPFTESKDEVEIGETRRLLFPMARPSNVSQAGEGSGHDFSSFISNTQPRLGQANPFPPQYAYGNTQGASIPFTGLSRPQLGHAYRLQFPMAGPSNVGQEGKGSGHGVSFFISNTQPHLGQTIPFPSQDAYGNTQGASIPFTVLSRPQLGQANRSNSNITPSVDIQTIGNLSSGLAYGPPGMGYTVVSRNNAQQVEQQQQYVDMPYPPPFKFHDIFRGNSQEFQQHIVDLGSPARIHDVLRDDSQQFQQQHIANLRHSPSVNNQNDFEGDSQELQQQQSLDSSSSTPSINSRMPEHQNK